ncbi:MAG: hypothetical protein CR974_02035 [Gammaproteobacteria bacterium]|nr:MAG: hypothetical protein CR974_02035 [Gammaproteobacteria bacterium]
MAVEYDGIFVTADRRHYEKVKQFGYIALLSDYVLTSSEIRVPNATTQKVLAEIDNGENLTEFSNTDELTKWLRED